MNFINFNAGVSITGNYTNTATYGSIGTVFALFGAKVSKNLFSPFHIHNIHELAKQFPTRVTISDTVVTFTGGPLLITSGRIGAFAIPALFSIVSGALSCFAIYETANFIFDHFIIKNINPENRQSIKYLMYNIGIVIMTSGLAFFACTLFFFSRLHHAPGVHLFSWSFNKIN